LLTVNWSIDGISSVCRTSAKPSVAGPSGAVVQELAIDRPINCVCHRNLLYCSYLYLRTIFMTTVIAMTILKKLYIWWYIYMEYDWDKNIEEGPAANFGGLRQNGSWKERFHVLRTTRSFVTHSGWQLVPRNMVTATSHPANFCDGKL
jgi:hypothetical protein